MNKKQIYPYWFLLVPLVFYGVFFLFPSALAIFYSFTDWNSRTTDNLQFVGLQNYVEIFTSDRNYVQGIYNTLKFTVVSNVVKIIPALFLAIMLQKNMKGRGLYRTILYLPAILPFVIIGLLFKSILSYNTGLVNSFLEAMQLGFLKQKWLSDLDIVWKSIYGVDAWRGIGYIMTIFIAGLSTIPKSYYEAAEIDGAGFWRKFKHITIPMLSGAIMINLIFGLTYGLKVFDLIYVLTNGGPGHATEVMTTYSYKMYSSGQYGMSSAFNTILLVITAVLGVLVVKKMSKREVQQ